VLPSRNLRHIWDTAEKELAEKWQCSHADGLDFATVSAKDDEKEDNQHKA